MTANQPKRKKTYEEKGKLKKLIPPIIIIAAVIIIDQLTKFWAVANLQFGNSVEIFGSFFMLTLVYNEGGAMGTNLAPPVFYLVASSIVLVLVLYYLYQQRQTYCISVPLAFIAGGAIGNLIDRFKFGQVVDFIDVDFFDISLFGYRLERWWTFNVADMAISISIIYLIILIMFNTEKKPPPEQPS